MTPLNPKTVHRTLFVRVLAMSVAIAVIVGLGMWTTERNAVGRDILVSAEAGFRMLNETIRPLLDDPRRLPAETLQRVLDLAVSQRRASPLGLFVWIGVYDLNGQPVATAVDETAAGIAGITDMVGKQGPQLKRYSALAFEVVLLDGSPHIRIISPLKNELNDPAAYAETVFAVAPEVLAGIRTRAMRRALVSAAVVLLTAALIYPVILTLLNRVTALSARLFAANLEILKVLGSAIAKRDSDTDAHNYRVTLIAAKLAAAVGLGEEDMRRLIKGAFLHDVGKIGIQDDILHKPGRLTEDEYAVMKRHVAYGLDIVSKAEWIRDAADIVGCHHEKFDGSGYGAGIGGEAIPVTARIFAIADVFDALTSRRPYKEAFPLEEAMAIIGDGRGTHFDPALVDTFAAMAADIHASYAGREDDDLRRELDAVIHRYFHTSKPV